MTYSLHTLNSSAPARDRDAPVRYGVSRFTHEIGLIVWAALLVLWLLALLTYHAQDPAWSTTGGSLKVLNWSGRLGAWLADVSYFMLGFSVWWGVAAAVRAWLASLARWMRADEAGQPGARWPFWLGLVLLVLASTALEWTRLYRFEGHLPGHAGGVLGGLSTGQSIVVRFAVKPTSSILTPRRTIDREGHDAEIVTKGRHDPCVGIRAVPVGEAMMACVLLDHLLLDRGQTGGVRGRIG